MTRSFAKCSKAQRKIQEMSFVLVAIVILFALASLFYLSVRMSSLNRSAALIEEDSAKSILKKMAGSPEFSWTVQDCAGCVDFDKVMALKNMSQYKEFWELTYFKIEKIYPVYSGECTSANYPNCRSITLIDSKNYGTPVSTFVSLCRYSGLQKRCELGKIYSSGKI